MSINNEVDLIDLNNPSINFVLPVLLPNNNMCFKEYLPNIELIKNKFGIPEPDYNKIVPAESIDLCLMPLVGFNRSGIRLGMGGGYYDRYFESNHKKKKPTILAGIAYDFQEDDTILSESWDIPLDMIFTNKEVIYCGQSR